MAPKVSPKVATDPAPADESTLEAYQQTLLKLQRLSLQTAKVSAGYSFGQTPYGQTQNQSKPQESGSTHSKVALRRDEIYMSASGISGLRGNETKAEIPEMEYGGHEENMDSNSEGEESVQARVDKKNNEEADIDDETEEKEKEEDDEEDEEDEDEEYCTCRRPGFGNMVKCNNQGCRYEWFHADCVGITRKPTAPWFCKECRIKMKGKARKTDEGGSRV